MKYDLNYMIKRSIEFIKEYATDDPYFVAYSGGKDSIVTLDLVKKANVKFEAHFHPTSLDSNSILKFIANQKEVIIDKPQITIWKLLKKELYFPTRKMRYCCRYLKECYGENRRVVTGVRRQESLKRSGYKEIQYCQNKGKLNFHPILNWSEKQIWEYIKSNNLPYPKEYDNGRKRIGCLFCPMSRRDRQKDYEENPFLVKKFIKYAQMIIDECDKIGKKTIHKTGEEYFNWWIEKDTWKKPLDNYEIEFDEIQYY